MSGSNEAGQYGVGRHHIDPRAPSFHRQRTVPMWNNLPFTDLLTQVGDTIMLALGAGIFSVSTWLAFRRRHAFDRHTWMVEITDASGDASYSQPLPLSDALTLAAKYDQVGLRTDVVALPQAHHRGDR